MRKNNFNNKGIRVFSVYRIKGRNVVFLINRCKAENISLFDVKKIDDLTTEISVNYKDSKKFFAILKELCYNDKDVTKIREKGLFYPILYLARNFGIVLGVISILITFVLSNDFIFDITYSGTGSVYKNEIRDYLSGKGIKKFSRFSNLDIKSLEDELVRTNDNLSFASVKKDGNRLCINVASTSDKVQVLKPSYSLISTYDGEISFIKIYSGTAVKKVGDIVKKGDLIVDGVMTINENTVKAEVVGCVGIMVTEKKEYRSKNDGEEEYWELFSLTEMGDIEPIEIKTEKNIFGEDYVYTVTLKYMRVIYP